uniref:FHOD1 N-terminal GTPase-binding domain-containing protein n=1 Tax=Anopheles atroparvus TaxID=41427 RepID=A0A182IR12_ANOAO
MEPDELMTVRVQYLVDSDPFNSLSMYPIPSRAPVFSFASAVPLATQLGALLRHLGAPQRLDDASLQVYKDGDYGAYLDLESSLAEQSEDIEGLNSNRSIIGLPKDDNKDAGKAPTTPA